MNEIPANLPRVANLALATLFFILLSPSVGADGEPPRINLAVLTAEYEEGTGYFLETEIRWIESNDPLVNGYAFNLDGISLVVTSAEVPFRPGWLWETPDSFRNLRMDDPNTTADFTISSLVNGSVVATSCNVTISARTWNASGFGNAGQSSSCGSPAYSHAITLTGSTHISGNDTTFRLNHTLGGKNATFYQYQYQVVGVPFWFTLEPTSGFTSGAANFTTSASLTGYRLANFTFPGTAGEADSMISWRVRAADTFTYETGQWSCSLDLPTLQGFARACKNPRALNLADGTPSIPFVDVAAFSLGLGLPVEIGAGIIAAGLMFLLGGITVFIGRDAVSGIAGASVGAVLSFQAALIPGWLVLTVFFFATIFTLNRVMGEEK